MSTPERPWLVPGYIERDARRWGRLHASPWGLHPGLARRSQLDAKLRRLGLEPPRKLTQRELITRLDAARQFPSS